MAIDLKSFYASVECVERGLDSLKTNLVVADATRTSKTICLAVSPSLKAYGIGGRARLFEVEQRVHQINDERLCFSPEGVFHGRSYHDPDVRAHDDWALDYIIASPRMRLYMAYSARIYKVYLRYFSKDDIHVYSIDEVFIDATDYLRLYHLNPHELTRRILSDVLAETGITATAGIGTNMYLCKVAMDIVAKHIPPDKDGVRIAELDEVEYRRQLWNHTPLTDFWRIGRGIARKLRANGMETMGDVARRSLTDEDLFFRLFGVNGEYVVDHAWGYEPITMADIKAYRPQSHSLSSGQVLTQPYTADQARIVVMEMAYNVALSLVRKGLLATQVVLYVGYDVESLSDGRHYDGVVVSDHYGRAVPQPAHGSTRFKHATASSRMIGEAVGAIYDRVVDRSLLVRRLNIAVATCSDTGRREPATEAVQLNLFSDSEAEWQLREAEEKALERERRIQQATIAIQEKFGKNALLRGINFAKGATMRERNKQVGGHRE